ncbi:MAG: PAS domain S-box protein [Candidatus Methylopumilus sp.]|nr:PAS domain S-box protein [Candidatus Methylopumilus sp.]
MNLRVRLNLLITAILLIFFISMGYTIIKGSKESIQEGVESANRVTMQLLDTVIISSVQNPEWGYTHDVMKRFLEELGHVRSSDIYLFNLQGDLLYHSPPSKYRSEDSPTPKWFINSLSPKEEVDTRMMRFGKLVVKTNPAGAIKEAWSKMYHFFWIALIFFVLLNIAVYWMLGFWLKPLRPMVEAINKMGGGDFSARLPKFNLPEFAAIAINFNLMGDSLQSNIRENQRLALIAQQTADAIIIHDLHFKISFWNASAEKLFGYSAKEVLGRSAYILASKASENELRKNLELIHKRKNIHNIETQRVKKNGDILNVTISGSPLIDPITNQVIGDICSMRDISEKKIAEESKRKLEENRKFTQLIQSHIEDERRSLARELHDEMGQYVSAIKIFAANISNKAKKLSPEIEKNAESVISAANQIYDGMHSIIKQLRPGSLDSLGLADTLKDTVNSWQKQYKHLDIHLSIMGDLAHLNETLNINIYRIIQEAMNNVIKHSEAKIIEINLSLKKNGNLELNFIDNGKGTDLKTIDQTKNFGILGIQERVQSLNGSFELISKKNQGTQLSISLPV